jgi:hypothetical protein
MLLPSYYLWLIEWRYCNQRFSPVYEKWIKRYSKELLQLLGGTDIPSFVRISRFSWIGHAKKKWIVMEKWVKYVIIIPREVDYKDGQKGSWNCVKESRNRPGVAQRVPGGLGSQISWHSVREGGEVVILTHRPPLPPGHVPGTHFH